MPSQTTEQVMLNDATYHIISISFSTACPEHFMSVKGAKGEPALICESAIGGHTNSGVVRQMPIGLHGGGYLAWGPLETLSPCS